LVLFINYFNEEVIYIIAYHTIKYKVYNFALTFDDPSVQGNLLNST